MSNRNRTHGHETERMIVRYLREAGWPDACTTRAKLGHDGAHAPGDISVWPGIVIEAKSVKKSAWPTWCAQAVAEAGPNRVPVVVRRTRGVPDVGQWETRIRAGDWESLGGCPVSTPLTAALRLTATPPELVWVRVRFVELCELVREDVTT